MGRPPKPDSVNEKIDFLWVEEVQAAKKTGKKPIKANVWRSFHGNIHRGPSSQSQIVSLSYVERRIREKPGLGSEGLPVFNEWKPWSDEEENSEDRAFLLRLHAIKFAETNSWLLQHEADWGRKLRAALEGLQPYAQWRLVDMYAKRQVNAQFFGHELPFTADLDGLLAYKPWVADYRKAYGLAVASGIYPAPMLNPPAYVEAIAHPWESVEDAELLERPELLGTLWEYIEAHLVPNRWLVLDNPLVQEHPEEFPIVEMLNKVLDFWENPDDPRQISPPPPKISEIKLRNYFSEIQGETQQVKSEEGGTDERINS